jgi:hypothetical protein
LGIWHLKNRGIDGISWVYDEIEKKSNSGLDLSHQFVSLIILFHPWFET